MNPSRVDFGRIRRRNDLPEGEGVVLYWMHREMRVSDNWALLFAREKAVEKGVSLAVVFCLDSTYPGAVPEHFIHLLQGLQEVTDELQALGIPFFLVEGNPPEELCRLAKRCEAGLVVTDFSPLRTKETWTVLVAKNLTVACYEVDAHNVVPAWLASPKKEYSAATFRPKIHNLLPRFLVDFPRLEPLRHSWHGPEGVKELSRLIHRFGGNGRFPWPAFPPGSQRALENLERFAAGRLADYATAKNDPTKNALSGLSVPFHFGHLAPQRAALRVRQADISQEAKEAFLEELVVRRELADNFCFYEKAYDAWEGFPSWVRKTLEKHAEDPRPVLYDDETLEQAATHDEVWNAAQREMRLFGKMHGYMRMYWGKKLLEWSVTPVEALRRGIRMNDRYELDGRDPNGYAGVAWAIGGLHDRPWPERPIFGTLRYMNAAGLKRKFNIEAYIRSISKKLTNE